MGFAAANMNGVQTTEYKPSTRRKRAAPSNGGGAAPHYRSDDEAKGYKSKNLIAERKRRQKLTDRLHLLRASVPIITNMNKATIIDDAITYIQDLMKNVEVLSAQLNGFSASEQGPRTNSEPDEVQGVGFEAEEMKSCGIQEEVEVVRIDGKKLWVKIVMEKRRGRFTRLVEGMTRLGLQPVHTNMTTSKGAFLVSSCVEVDFGDTALMVQRTKELLIQVIRGI